MTVENLFDKRGARTGQPDNEQRALGPVRRVREARQRLAPEYAASGS